ncbi:ABC transporter permease [Streptomyces sp. NPDC056069]|uniref:ABC transporter permease n=1 Tax=Streptomyces sp. NPDC056069 TaxID=3345702 RepID=UPI0035DC97BF
MTITEAELRAGLSRRLAQVQWSVTDSLVIARRHLIRISRIPQTLIFAVIQPVMFIVMFSYVFSGSMTVGGSTDPAAYREFLIAGVLAQTVTFTATTTCIGIADDMRSGIDDRFRTLPMSHGAVLAGRHIANLAQIAVTLTVLAAVALLTGWRIHTTAFQALAAFALLLLLGYAFSWIGALTALHARTPETAGTAGLLWVFPLTFISNAFADTANMTPWLRHTAEWNPFSAVVQSTRTLFGSPGTSHSTAWPMQHPIPASLLWCLLLITIFRTLSIHTYRTMTKV